MTSDIKPLIEAALFAAGRALKIEDLAKTCGSGNIGLVRRSVEDIIQEYADRNSGISIRKTSDGYLMHVRPELEDDIMHLVPETEIPAPVLKTLALIAYEQPIKQSDLVKERGNKVYGYVKLLKKQGLVESRKEGRTRILSVTPRFRDYFCIEDLKKFISKEDSKDAL